MPEKPNIPVIFLAFANAKEEGQLEHLKMESAALRDIFLLLKNEAPIDLLREESTESKDLPKLLTTHKDQVAIFHYGGHADGAHLVFEDRKGGAAGLAELLALQKNLKLAFLNGCSTQHQAQPYLEAGIPVVIATTTSIPDEGAAYFAERFYHALANRHTIREAFQAASGTLRSQTPHHQARMETGIVPYRAAVFDKEEIRESPWQLFVGEGQEALLDQRLSDIIKTPYANRRIWVWAALLLILGAVGLFAALTPKKGFPVKLEVACERVTFRYLGGGRLLGQQALQKMKVQDFEEVAIQADSLMLDNGSGSGGFPKAGRAEASLLTLQPIPGIGSEVTAAPVGLSNLLYADSALLTLGLAADKSTELSIYIQQSESTNAEFYFQDSISFYASYVEVSGWGNGGEAYDFAGKAYSPAARRIFVTGSADATLFSMQFADSLDITSRDMRVAEMTFLKKDEGRTLSTILGGTASLTDKKGREYRHIPLPPGEKLGLQPAGPLALTRITVEPDSIRLFLEGSVNSLQTGPEATPQNPSIAEWLWHGRKLLLLFLVPLVFAGAIFASRGVR